jgi:rare lipoprotein A
MKVLTSSFFRILLAFLCSIGVAIPVYAGGKTTSSDIALQKKKTKTKIDRSGKPRKGKASYYSRRFAGKKMADGTPMNPNANVAASKTLPLGTKAQVTNLENGKSAVVEIRDRGPYVDGRIVDLSPKVAKNLDIQEQGVAQVEVKPLELPSSSGDDAGPGSSAAGK